jgi:hypothetical protein
MPEFHEVTRPYPGLRPFESWEGEIFFGREEHTNRLLDILQRQRFLAVIGPSGSGKSSLVRAGLLPALPLGSLGTGSDWRIALMRPGHRPMQRLAHALIGRSALGIELVGEERIPQDERHLTSDVALIEAELRRGPLGLVDVVKDARTRQTSEELFNLLVLVDQFEEIFTYVDAGSHQADESEAFVNLLLASRTALDTRIYIALTMRTDFLGNCVRFLELPDAINRAQYLTPRLTREQIERTIIGPARLFEGDVEPTLVAEMVNSVSNDPDQLPILQHALARMWDSASRRNAVETGRHTGMDRRYPDDTDVTPNTVLNVSGQNQITWEDFKVVGGITDALSRHADEILASLSPKKEIEEPLAPEQRTAEVLFRAITGQRGAEAGGQAVRRPQSLDQIANWSGRDWQDFLPVVRAFAQEDVNFLNYVGELTPETVVDISHEALIRQWGRLREWVADEARLAAEYRRWRERADAWAAGAGALLTGADLARAVEWRFGYDRNLFTGFMQTSWKPSPRWASRYSKTSGEQSNAEFQNVLKFIDESQQVVLRAEKRERRIKWFMAVLTVMSLTAMTVAIGFAIQARDRQIVSEAAALWHPLDFSGQNSDITDKQAEGLLRLARSDEPHKRAFLEQLLKGESLAGWFNYQPQAIMSAAVGLNLERRSWFLDRLYEIAPENETWEVIRVARALALLELEGKLTPEGLIAAIQATEDSDQLEALGKGMAAVAGMVPEAQARAVAKKFLDAMQVSKASDRRLKALSQGLAALPIKLTEAQAAAMADEFAHDIRTTIGPYQLGVLGHAMAAVAGKVPEAQAGAVAKTFLAAIPTVTDTYRQGAFGQGVAVVAGKVPEAQAGAVAEKLVAAIQATKEYTTLRALLVQGLAAVAGKVPEGHAGAVAEKLVAAIQAAQNPEEQKALGQGVAVVAGKVPEAQSGAVAETILDAIRTAKDFSRPEALGQSLAVVAGKVPQAQAGAVAKMVVDAIRTAKDSNQLEALGQGLAAAAAKVPEGQAGAVAEIIVDAIWTTQDSDRLETPGVGLAAASKVPKAQAGAVAEKFLDAVRIAKDPTQLQALGKGLAALPLKLTEAQAAAMADEFAHDIRTTINPYQLGVLVESLAALPVKLPGTQAGAIAEKFVATIEASKYNFFLLGSLGRGVAAMADKVPETQAGALAEKFLDAIRTAEDSNQRHALSQGLVELADKVPEAQAGAVAEKFVAVIQATEDSHQLEPLGQGVVAATARISSDGQGASLFFELLKNPLIRRDTITDTIRKRFPDAPAEEKGFWALIQWADKRFPYLDLDAPLKKPSDIAATLHDPHP